MQTGVTRLIDALPGLAWTALADGQADHVGRAWLDFTGLRPGEATGMGWLAAVHPQDAPRVLDTWTAIVASGRAGEVESRLRRSDGVYRRFLLRANPMPGPAGKAPSWCVLNLDVDDQMRAEAAIGEQQRRFQEIVDGLPAIVVLCDRDGRISMANKHMLEYHGWTLEELREAPPLANCHPDDRAELLDNWRGCLKAGRPLDGETRLLRADGAYLWHRVRALPLADGEGGIDLWYGLLTDIDDTKRAEANLAAEKRLLEMIAMGAATPDILAELCRQVEGLAPGCLCSILLVDPREATFLHGAGPSLPDAYNAVFDGKPIDRTYGPCSLAATIGAQVITADVDADARWAASPWPALARGHGLRSCWSTPILSANREVMGVFALYQRQPDSPSPLQRELIERFSHLASLAIEHELNAAALRASQAYLAEAQRLSQTGSFGWRVSTDQHFWSEETFRIFGFEPSSTVSALDFLDRVHPDDAPRIRQAIAVAHDGKDLDLRFRLLMPDASIRHLHLVAHGARDQEGRLEYIGAIQDVTERLASEEALNKARSELAHVARITTLSALTASITHEVNQPLAGIITNASTCLRMLAADPPDLDGARATAQRTIRDGNRASEVIQRLRALFGRKPPSVEPVDLNEAAREVLALSASELERRRVVLRTDLTDDLPMVEGDRVQLQQVILNLILNAADAMSEVDDRPRDVWVTAGRGGSDQVAFSVRDAGVGIEPQNIERIFDTFYTTKAEGMGIGLSVSRSIIQGHDGRLVATANDGPGATFSFAIPCRPREPTELDGYLARGGPAGPGAQQLSR